MVLKGKRNFLFYAGLNDILGVAVGDRVKLVYKTKRPSCTVMKKRCVEHCEEIGEPAQQLLHEINHFDFRKCCHVP